MPAVTFINETQVPLHVALKHISPLHYVTVEPNGGSQTITKVGHVWFTIEARIDRGDNSYTKWDTYVPIVAMSVGVLSLGAGAVYIAGASAAAGSTSAAVAAISSRIGAQAALHAPTVRRLYAYAQKGQAIVKIGQVIGIGGGAAAGKLLGKDKRVEAKNGELEVEAKGKGSWLGFGDWRDERKNTKQAKKVLKSLLEGSVISSHGWFIGSDRTIRITGGPKATEIEDLLVIETDTNQPFELIDASTGKKTKTLPSKSKSKTEAKAKADELHAEGTEKTTLFDGDLPEEKTEAKESEEVYLKALEKQKEKEEEEKKKLAVSTEDESEDEAINSGTNTPAQTFGEKVQHSWDLSRNYTLLRGNELLNKWKKGKDVGGEAVENPEVEENGLEILMEMGFDKKESEEALVKSKGNTQEAIEILFKDPKNSNLEEVVKKTSEKSETSTSTVEVSSNPTSQTNDTVVPSTDSTNDASEKKNRKVVGGEHLEKAHWSKPISDMGEKVGASKILKYGSDYAVDWLGKDGKAGASGSKGTKK